MFSFLYWVSYLDQVLGKTGAKSEDIKAAIDLKRNLEDIKIKCKELNLVTMEPEKLQEADISGRRVVGQVEDTVISHKPLCFFIASVPSFC